MMPTEFGRTAYRMPSRPVIRMNPPGSRSPCTADILALPRSTEKDGGHLRRVPPSSLGTYKELGSRGAHMLFCFPEDARWNADRQAVEFGVGVGDYEGIVSIPRQVFRR